MVSLISLTLLYGVLAVVEVGLILRFVQARAADPFDEPPDPDARRRPPTTRRWRSPTEVEETRPWSSPPSGSRLIAVLWIGYFSLEGFDFGVGMLLPVLARDDRERRVMINTIGPVWDGNEVWVLIAGGATFAAFPEWYATLFSGFYLPLLLILLALIVRGLAFEYRHQRPDARWRRAVGPRASSSARSCRRCCGAWRSPTSSGVSRSTPTKEFTGTLFTLLNPYALLGGLVTLLLFLTHGAMFVALKTDGEIRHRARALAVRLGVGAAVVAVAFLVWTQIDDRHRRLRGRCSCSPRCALVGRPGRGAARAVRAGRSSAPSPRIALAVAGLFVALFPDVMPSTTDAGVLADHDQRVGDRLHAEGHDRVAAIFTPLVLAYQAWTYWVFRKRIARPPHPRRTEPAARRRR